MPKFPSIPSNPNFFQLQSEILRYREENKIFQKSISNRDGAENFTIFDGPPFKNGTPHYGHVLQSTIKDTIPRFWTMKGKKVPRTRGWDCHGIYIEQKVQKHLGLRTNSEIEVFGVENFIKECYRFTNMANDERNRTIPNIGRWVDMENAYETMSNNYMESVRYIFKNIYDQGKIYKGKRVSMYSTKLNTAIGNFEVQADNSYAEINDPAITVKFKVNNNIQNKNILTSKESVEASSEFEQTEDGAIKVVCANIRNDSGQLLMIESKKYGDFTLPGGKVYIGESYEQALIREIKQETDLNIIDYKFLGSIKLCAQGKFYCLYIYDCFVNGNEKLMELEKHESLNWVSVIDSGNKLGFGIKNGDICISNEQDILSKYCDAYYINNVINIVNQSEDKPIYFLAWTTTPWTIPANVALVLNSELDYVQIFDIKTQEYYILANDLVSKYYKNPEDYIYIYKCKGSELVGINYEAPFDYYSTSKLTEINKSDNNSNIYNSHKIYAADYVTSSDGTGIVHTAPEFGEDDFVTGKKYDLYQTNSLNEEGRYTSEIYNMKGLYYRKDDDSIAAGESNANEEVMRLLTEKGLLFRKESITHTVPMCPRTLSPLIYKTQDSWFINISSIKPQLLAQNENINRVPNSIKHSRFAKSIETAPDRCISRTKYRATPMPVRVAKDSEGNIINTKVMGSREDIYNLDQTGSKLLDRKMGGNGLYVYLDAKTAEEFDFHRPYIDAIWGKDGDNKYIRTSEVLDPWMDSGSMSFAQLHYPFENVDKFEAGFPADFIGEGAGQIRCRFQMMHNISTLITGKNAYKNVIVTGTVQGNDGRKMSKSFGNYPDIRPTIEKYGGDSIRMMLLGSPLMTSGDLAFSEEGLKEVLRKINLPLWNSYSFFTTYANIDNFEATKHSIIDFNGFDFTNDLDEWIISKLAILIDTVNISMTAYDIQSAIKPIYIFIDDLTNRYIRRNRRRFRKSENDIDKMNGYDVLYVVLIEFCKILAPFMPFLSEYIYRNLTKNESVHLEYRTE